MSAYACEPGKGSEPGVGWSIAKEMAQHHDVWVLTRANNRAVIEEAMRRDPTRGLKFVYSDLPNWAQFWKRGRRGVHFYYYLWQLRALSVARALHTEVKFDLVHHVTFVRYWAPSFLCFLDLPLVWGPVGGGETAPRSFWVNAGGWSLLYETSRSVAGWIGGHGPFVRATARRSVIALATTDESAARLRAIGSRRVETLSQVGLPAEELDRLGGTRRGGGDAVRFVSVGQLIHLKGFDISLRAFASANIPGAEYWFIGDGRERQALERLAERLGVADRVRFCGMMPRVEVLARLRDFDVMLHPALHDSGGCASVEGMAAGLPVICLDLGGPATQVTPEAGFKIPARNPEQASRDMAAAMLALAGDKELRSRLSRGARERARREFCWSAKAERFNAIYAQAISGSDG
jgi:glycosyltransferase involved in cell wall biosynthesis